MKMFLNHNIQLHKTNYIIYLFHNLSHIICVKSNTSLLVYCLKYSLQQETAVSWMYSLDRFFFFFFLQVPKLHFCTTAINPLFDFPKDQSVNIS